MVSILSTFNNINTLKILDNIISNQTYKNINEWIIITNNDISCDDFNNNNIIKFTNNNNLINMVNNNFIILMNENVYYFSNYIEQCFNKLLTSSQNVGLKEFYIHNYINNLTYKCNNINTILCGLHTCNMNSLDNLQFIDSSYGLIKNVYDNNIDEYHSYLTLAINNINNVQIMEKNFIKSIVNNDVYNMFNNIYNDNNYLDYDIVYLTGGTSIFWDPEDSSLGGSEQAIVNLVNELANNNKKIVVYGNFKNEKKYNNVDYMKWSKFPFNKKIKNLIAWRRHGLTMLMNNDFMTDNLIIDFHDNFSYTLMDLNSSQLLNIFDKVNTFNFKSNYHKESFIEFLKLKNINANYNNKYNIIPNGIRVQHFKLNNNYIRNPYRFCYCSSYDRGLDTIIKKLWNEIYKSQPLAELHVYYGMDYLFDENYKLHLKLLLSQPGVMDHGRQPMEMIVREKYLSTFHIYLNNSIAEIDCISIKESLVTGCIPIISNFGVFKERHGIQYEWEPDNDNLCQLVAKDIINKMNDFNLINNIRNMVSQSSTIISWTNVSDLWLTNIL